MGEGRWYNYDLVGSWVFWVYPWNTRICIWAFETITWPSWIIIPLWLPHYSVPMPALLSPYSRTGKLLTSAFAPSPLLKKPVSDWRLRVSPGPQQPSQGRKGSCCACLVGLDRRETGSAHGRSRKTNAKLSWRGKGKVDLDSSSQPSGRSNDDTLGWTPTYFFPSLLANPNLEILPFYLENEHLLVAEK